MEVLYDPDHIFGDEDTWCDAPAQLAEQGIQEYFDALEEQDALGPLPKNRFVHDPMEDHYPVLPTVTLQNKITAFVTSQNLNNNDAEYVQLSRLSNKLVDLQEEHEEDMRVQDRMIDTLLRKLSAVKSAPYKIDNIYSGYDCKRKRDLIVDQSSKCVGTKQRLEEQYLGTFSMLAGKVREIKANVRRARDERLLRARWLTVIDQLRTVVQRKDELEVEVGDLRADTEQLRAHLRAHRNAIILERRRRDSALRASEAYLEQLGEERLRARELDMEVNQQARQMQEQKNWIQELETRGMRGEVFNKQSGSWEMARAARKRGFNEYQVEENIKEEREIKRERLK